MAAVFRGFDPELRREVAVKLLHPLLASCEEARERLRREARAVAGLRHRNILQVYDCGVAEGGEVYLVSELLPGPSLHRFVRQHGPLLSEVAAAIGWVLASALAAAHEQGIIHRDLKPENVLLGEGGRLVVCDFGIARALGDETLTQTGAILGSPAFMSPEQAASEPCDHRSDLYSLGVILYNLATSHLPFGGDGPLAVMLAVSRGRHLSPLSRNPAVAPALEQIIERCLKPRLEDRYADGSALAAALLPPLEAAGLAAPEELLSRFFQRPAEVEAELRPRIVAATLRQAAELQRRGRIPPALAECGRALALAPDSSEAAALLSRFDRGRRRARAMTLLAAVLAGSSVFGAVGVAWRALWPAAVLRAGAPRPVASDGSVLARRPIRDLTSPLAAEDGGGATSVAADAGTFAASTLVRNPPLHGAHSSPRLLSDLGLAHWLALDAGSLAQTEDAAQRGLLRVAVTPWCDVWLDGNLLGRTTQLLSPVEVSAGRHLLVCRQGDSGPELRRDVQIQPGKLLTVRERLFEAAAVEVRLRRGSEVEVDGRVLSPGRHSLAAGRREVVLLRDGAELERAWLDVLPAGCTLTDEPRLGCR